MGKKGNKMDASDENLKGRTKKEKYIYKREDEGDGRWCANAAESVVVVQQTYQ